jgi:hypothetical protein
MEGRCIWCGKNDIDYFVNKKYRHYKEKLTGYVCKDCWSELYDLNEYMKSQSPVSEIGLKYLRKSRSFIGQWQSRPRHRPHNAI